MKITYLYHSGFCVELESAVLIFDYYKGDIPAFPMGKPVYFFASHKHQDHFNMNVLNMLSEYSPTFVFSNDIRLSEKYLERYGYDCDIKNKIISAKKNDEFVLDNIRVRTYKSTDSGCAFLVEAEGYNIFHAGDLNWWAWPNCDEGLFKMQERIYKEQLGKMKEISIDVAFVPLDPRLNEYYYLGVVTFLDMLNVKRLFPMHMWDRYEIIQNLLMLPEMDAHRDKIVLVDKNSREWIV